LQIKTHVGTLNIVEQSSLAETKPASCCCEGRQTVEGSLTKGLPVVAKGDKQLKVA